MAEDEDFEIVYKGQKVKVSPVLNGAQIYFVVHLKPPVAIAEGMVNEEWIWIEAGMGDTPLAAELGDIIERMGI